MAVANGGMTLYTDNDTQQNWAGTDGLDTEVFKQGVGSESWLVSKNSTETGTLTLSANMGTAKYFTFWMKSDIFAYYTDISAELQSTAGNYETFIASTSAIPDISGDFKPSVLQIGQGTATGTYVPASHTVLRIIVDNSASGNIRSITNHWIDAMYYGTGRTITGSTVGDEVFGESDALDKSSDTYDGLSDTIGGVVFFQSDVVLNTTVGNSHGETVVFRSARNTDNIYTLDITGTASFVNTSITASGATIAIDSTTATAFSMEGGAVTNGAKLAFTTGQTFSGVVFTGCDEIDTNGATMSNCVIGSTTEATTGSLILNSTAESILITNMQFKDYPVNYAVYVPAGVTAITMDNWQFDDPNNTTNFAVYWAGTVGTLTISAINGTNLTVAGCTSAGGTVSVSQDVTLEITNVVIGSRVRVDTVDAQGNLSTNLISEEATTSTVSTTVNYAGLDFTDVSIRVRKGSAAPKYYPYSASGIISTTGLSVKVDQQLNTLVDL